MYGKLFLCKVLKDLSAVYDGLCKVVYGLCTVNESYIRWLQIYVW